MKKLSIIFSVLFLLSFQFAHAQAPSWEWAKILPDVLQEGIAVDKAGNTYSCGSFGGSTVIFNSDTLINEGYASGFIAKYDSNGNVIWGKGIKSPERTEAFSITTDRSGNAYVIGHITDLDSNTTITFGKIVLNIKSPGDYVFLVKYNATGSAVWAKTALVHSDDDYYHISCDSNNNIYGCGNFGALSMVIENDTIRSTTGGGFFLVKYDSSGKLLWAKNAGKGNKYFNYYSEIILPKKVNANIYTSGYFSGKNIFFGQGITLNNIDIYQNNDNPFIAEYDSNGKCQWANNYASCFLESFERIAQDEFGNIFVSGRSYCNTIVLGKDTLQGSSFVAKMDGDGNPKWVQVVTSDYGAAYTDITTDLSGNVICTGLFNNDLIIGAYKFIGSTTMPSLFIVKYDSAGNVTWVKVKDSVNAGVLDCDMKGNAITIGYFNTAFSVFGKDTLRNINPNEEGIFFIAKLGSVITNIKPIVNNNSFKIYPNPAKNSLTFSFPYFDQTNGEISITNMLGQIVYSNKLTSNAAKEYSLSISDLSKGIYIVSLNTPEGMFESKFVKE
jgi:hypothetical protein